MDNNTLLLVYDMFHYSIAAAQTSRDFPAALVFALLAVVIVSHRQSSLKRYNYKVYSDLTMISNCSAPCKTLLM